MTRQPFSVFNDVFAAAKPQHHPRNPTAICDQCDKRRVLTRWYQTDANGTQTGCSADVCKSCRQWLQSRGQSTTTHCDQHA